MEAHRTHLTAFFSGLAPAVEIARRAQREMDRRAATKFSTLDFFRSSSDSRVREVHLSRIFGGLLDPSGAHGQGDRFLSLFLKETLPDFSYGDLTSVRTVHLEYSTQERRRIDIVLEMPGNHWIGIENKPWAVEGESQVQDYLKDLGDRARNGGTARMLYLSGDGSDPQLPESLMDFSRTVPYRKIGNGGSVEGWIEQCWRECEAERVRWFLQDLLEYIQRMFKENQAMAQNVIVDTTVDFILNDPEGKHLALALEVEKAMPQIRTKLVQRVLKGTERRLEEWCKSHDWDVFSYLDPEIYLGMRRQAWPKTNRAGWDVGVCILHDRIKVHLPDDEPVDDFKGRFDERLGERTRKWTNSGSSLIEQTYDLYSEENTRKSMEGEKVADELAGKLQEWASTVDEAVGE